MPSVINGFYSMLQIVFFSPSTGSIYMQIYPARTDGKREDFKHGTKAIIGGMASVGFRNY